MVYRQFGDLKLAKIVHIAAVYVSLFMARSFRWRFQEGFNSRVQSGKCRLPSIRYIGRVCRFHSYIPQGIHIRMRKIVHIATDELSQFTNLFFQSLPRQFSKMVIKSDMYHKPITSISLS